MYEMKDAATCQYSACDRPIVRNGPQGRIPKLYCSNSCRTRASQERRQREDEQPAETVRGAAIRARNELNTPHVNYALSTADIPEDVRHNFREAHRVLSEIVKRIPRTPE